MDTYLLVQDILKDVDSGIKKRILWIKEDNTTCLTIQLEVTARKIEKHYIKALEEKLEYGEIELLDSDPTLSDISYDEMTIAEQDLFSIAYACVQYIFESEEEPYCYSKKNISQKVNELMADDNILPDKAKRSKKAIYSYVTRYLQGGQSESALFPKLHKCGHNGGKRCVVGNKRGRKVLKEVDDPIEGMKEVPIESGILMKEQDIVNVTKGLKRWFLNGKGMPLTKVVEHIREIWYPDSINCKEKEDQYPSYWQIRKILNDYFSSDEISIRQRGKNNFEKNERLTPSDTVYASLGRYIYETDSTPGDFQLVDIIDRSINIGRPTILSAKDASSKIITGIHIFLGGASWIEYATLLYNCIENKAKYAAKYGIILKPGEWDVEGVPKEFFTDRGLALGPLADRIPKELRVNVSNAAAGRPDLKGNIEQWFHTLNQMLASELPGHIDKPYRERGDHNPMKDDGKLDIIQFTRVVIRAVLLYNASVMEQDCRTQDMINDGVRLIPNEIWKWTRQWIGGKLQRPNQYRLFKSLLRIGKVKVTKSGFVYKKILIYQWPENVDTQLYGEIYYSKKYVDCYFDDRDMSYIFIDDKNKKEFIACPLARKKISMEKFSGKSLRDIELFIQHLKHQKKEWKQEMAPQLMEFHKMLEQEIKEALELGEGIKTKGNVNQDERNEADRRLAKEQAFTSSIVENELANFNEEAYRNERDSSMTINSDDNEDHNLQEEEIADEQNEMRAMNEAYEKYLEKIKQR